MFNHRGLRPLRQFKMVAIVRGVDFVAVQTLSDMHQQQRLRRTLVTFHADMRHRLRQTFGEMQEDLRLHRRGQTLMDVIHGDLKAAVSRLVTEFRVKHAVDKDQTQRIHR